MMPPPASSLGAFRAAALKFLVVTVGAAAVFLAVVAWFTPPSVSGPRGSGSWQTWTQGWFTTTGFYPLESDPTRDIRFSWTGASATLAMPNLDRSKPYRLAIVLCAGRPPGPPLPVVHVGVDGLAAGVMASTNELRTMVVPIPARRERAGAVISFDVSDTFVPGPQDPRKLGVYVTSLRLVPVDSRFLPRLPVAVEAWLVVVLCTAAVMLCRLPAWAAFLLSSLSGAVVAWLLVYNGAFIGTYIDRLLPIAIGTALLGAAVGAVSRWKPVLFKAAEWSMACGVVFAATSVKLMLFAHPEAALGDSVFHVHRAEFVHHGKYFFTSVTLQPFFSFPYAIALYVNALPFWSWFPSVLDQVHLLRGLALGAEALVGVALYIVARRQWDDRRIAFACTTLWTLVPASARSFIWANLTNVYGQGAFGLAMAVVLLMAAGGRVSPAGVGAASALFALGFLSHFSTLATGVVIVACVVLVLTVLCRDGLRRLGVAVLLAAVVATGFSYAVYYRHFSATYHQTFDRVIGRDSRVPGAVRPAERTGVATDAGGAPSTFPSSRSLTAPLAAKVKRWLFRLRSDFGLLLLGSAAGGLVLLWLRRRRDGVTPILSAWIGAWAILSALGVLTAVELRADLAVAPAVVMLAALGLGSFARLSRTALAVSVIVLGAVAAQAARVWMSGLL